MIEWAPFHLGKYLCDVGANDAQWDEYEASDQPYGEHQWGPSLYDMTADQGINDIDTYEEGDDEEENANVVNGEQGACGEGGDPIEG